MSDINGPEQLSTPALFSEGFTLHRPKSMIITGEIQSYLQVYFVLGLLNQSVFYNSDSHFHEGEFNLWFLAMRDGIRESRDRLMNEHPSKLIRGAGLAEGQATEAMFVGNPRRKLKSESYIWLGRALASEHIERTYYLDPSGSADKVLGVDVDALKASGLEIISNTLDVFRFVNDSNGVEVPYTAAGNSSFHGVTK